MRKGKAIMRHQRGFNLIELLIVPSTSSGLAAGESAVVQLLDGAEFQCDPGFEGGA